MWVYVALITKHEIGRLIGDEIMITIDRDPKYAPVGYLICKVDNKGCWDTRNENSILIDSDWDFPILALNFGFCGCEVETEMGKITAAIDFLDDHLGKIIEDTGYFDNDN